MKTKVFSFAFLLLLSTAVSAQRTISKSNVLFGPMFKMINTMQEVKISPRLTVATTVRTRPASTLKLFGLGNISMEGYDYQPFGKTKLSMIGNITEFRIYGKPQEGKKKGAFNGFYFGPYFSYTHYRLQSASFRGEFHDATGEVYYADVSHSVRLNQTGGGFEIGTQGMYLNNHLAIDWTILGVGVGALGFQGTIDAENTSNNFDFRNYPDDVAKVKMGVEKVFHHIDRTVEPTSISIGFKIPMIMMRTGLCIGFGY
jgi:hypothetical protein